MSFALARAQRDAYLLTRMEAEELGQWIAVPFMDAESQDAELEIEHRHGDTCSCNLRGE